MDLRLATLKAVSFYLLHCFHRLVGVSARQFVKSGHAFFYSINEGNFLCHYLRFELLRLHFKMLEILKRMGRVVVLNEKLGATGTLASARIINVCCYYCSSAFQAPPVKDPSVE
jgi:hypothetical protein